MGADFLQRVGSTVKRSWDQGQGNRVKEFVANP